MTTKEERAPGAAEKPRVPEIVLPKLDLAWADRLQAWYLDRFLILVAEGSHSTAAPPVKWRSEGPPARYEYSLCLSKPERFLQASAFPMDTLMRSVKVLYAGHPEGVALPVTPLKEPSEQELLERTQEEAAPDERWVPSPGLGGEWELAPARFVIPFSLRGHLLLVARGEHAAPCFEVRWSTQRPDTYVLQRRRTAKNCPDVISPYMAVETFLAAPLPEAVRVIHAACPEGELLKVRPLEKMEPLRVEEAPLAH